jgi:hypothetical protein
MLPSLRIPHGALLPESSIDHDLPGILGPVNSGSDMLTQPKIVSSSTPGVLDVRSVSLRLRLQRAPNK